MDGGVLDLGGEEAKAPAEVPKEEKTTQVNCQAQQADDLANDSRSENASSSMVLLHEIEEFIHKM